MGNPQTTTTKLSKPTSKGVLIDATELFNATAPFIEEKEIVTIEAKDYPINANVPILVNKGEKVSIRVIKEYIGSTTPFSQNRINHSEKDDESVPKEEFIIMEKKVEELNAIINSLNDIIDKKEEDKKSNNLLSRGGFSMLNQALINKIGSFLLLIISIFVAYCMSTTSLFSPIGGFLILVISLSCSILFWIYSSKIHESRC